MLEQFFQNTSVTPAQTMAIKFRNNSFLIIGRAGLDLYADPPGSEIEHAVAFQAALGGSAANIAVALTKQGCKTALLTSVSNDAVGRYTQNQLQNYGVDTQYIRTISGEVRTSLAVVETRTENCQSVIYRNGAADFQLNSSDLQYVPIENYAAIIVTGTALAIEPSRSAIMQLLHKASKATVPIILDVDYRPYSWSSRAEAQRVCADAAGLCNIVVGNDVEFGVLAGEGDGLQLAQKMAFDGNRLIIYKKGELGCTTFAGQDTFETPIFLVKALKPTGAGDGFMGGFIAGLVANMSVARAVERGAATAAIVVTRVGCSTAMPDSYEVDAFLRERNN